MAVVRGRLSSVKLVCVRHLLVDVQLVLVRVLGGLDR